MNPAPDADLHSVGQANFDWIVKEVADLAIAKAKTAPQFPELRWSAFLNGHAGAAAKSAPAKAKPAAKSPSAAPKKATAKAHTAKSS